MSLVFSFVRPQILSIDSYIFLFAPQLLLNRIILTFEFESIYQYFESVWLPITAAVLIPSRTTHQLLYYYFIYLCNCTVGNFRLTMCSISVSISPVFDASGHYGGSFYNGNTYWLGSSSLCARISKHPSRVPFKLGFFTARADFEFASIEPKVRESSRYTCVPGCLLVSKPREFHKNNKI